MASELTATLEALFDWNFTEGLTLSTVMDSGKISYSKTLENGTGDNQADLIWHTEATIAASGTDTYDLTALTTTLYGTALTITFVAVKAIMIVNKSTTAADDILIDATVVNAFTAPFNADASTKIEIPADSTLVLSNAMPGWTVTAGTGDILEIANDVANAITYDLIILGTSA